MFSNQLSFQVKKSVLLRLWVGALSCISFQAYANSEVLIRSPYDGTYPYQVVTEGSHPLTQKSPGIYSSHLSNGKDWNLLIPGQVLLGKDGNPFLSQLELTQFDQRHETFAVVDGSLYLFQNKNSDQDLQVIKLGEGSGTVGLFPVGAELKLPLIQTLDDLVIEPCQILSDGDEIMQAVGISIRCQHDCPPYYKNGLSFFVFLQKGEPANSATPLLQMLPLATEGDLKFMTRSELRDRICKSSSAE